jgi:hypothetical protein
MHTNSKLLFQKYAKPLLEPNSTVLEIGPDGFPSTLQELSKDLDLTWHTLDIYDNPQLTYPNSKEYSFAIPDERYDVVISAQVIEHVRRPWRWLPEVARVTRAGGLVITINPVSWVYHEAPVDCWRIYPEGMKALYEDASLTVLLSLWESLETPQFRRHQAGTSLEDQSTRRQRVSKFLGRFGFPVERAYDTITIGRKASTSNGPQR